MSAESHGRLTRKSVALSSRRSTWLDVSFPSDLHHGLFIARPLARSAKLVGTTERLLHRPQSEGVRLLLGPACPPGLAKQGRCRSAPRVCATQHTLLRDIREIGARGLPFAPRISRRDWAKSAATA